MLILEAALLLLLFAAVIANLVGITAVMGFVKNVEQYNGLITAEIKSFANLVLNSEGVLFPRLQKMYLVVHCATAVGFNKPVVKLLQPVPGKCRRTMLMPAACPCLLYMH